MSDRRQPYRIRPGVRYFLDADGFCWQEIQDNGHGLGVMHSMARVNPDNSPTPEPYLYLIPEDELPTWLLVPWWSRLSWWLRPYWHGLDRRVWRWQRKPCRYVVTGGSTANPADATGSNAYEPQPPSRLVVGSLCSGYEGLGMGLELGLGHNVRHAWFVENDPAPSKILARHHPDVPNLGDLKTLDYAAMEPVDILTAGYPCQPFSDAGLRKGADDPRHLWPYVADAVGALRPRVVLLENVRGHVRRGLDSVLADLAAMGYDARWGLVRASDAGAPHRRERIFVVAQDADSPARSERWLAAPGQAPSGRTWSDIGGRGGAPAADAERGEGGQRRDADMLGGRQEASEQARLGCGSAADADSDGLALVGRIAAIADADGHSAEPPAFGLYDPAVRRWETITGRAAPWATEPRGRDGAERLSPRFVEWMMGLPAGWVTDCDLNANEQLKALGNGVVPQQVALAVSVLGHNWPSVEVAA